MIITHDVDEADVRGKEVGADLGGTPDASAIQEEPGLKGAASQCLCPMGNWKENRERAKANDSPVWIQCSADAAMTILRKTYELSTGFECSCRFAFLRVKLPNSFACWRCALNVVMCEPSFRDQS